MKTYKDIYKFPLRLGKYSSWVYDDADNFVFQFEEENEPAQKLILNVLNGSQTLTNKDLVFKHEQGQIIVDENGIIKPIILIRGWGNLTGIGGHNLPSEEAANIQDTFAEFIVEQLNKRTVL